MTSAANIGPIPGFATPEVAKPQATYTDLLKGMGIELMPPVNSENPAQGQSIIPPEVAKPQATYTDLLKGMGIDLGTPKSPVQPQLSKAITASEVSAIKTQEHTALRKSMKNIAGGLGAIAASTVLLVGSVFALSALGGSDKGEAAVETVDVPEATNEVETTTTTEAIEEPTPTTRRATTTTEAPRPVEFAVGPGELVGTLRIPSICEDIEVYAYSEQEKIDGMIGRGDALIDKLTPDTTPTVVCESVEAYEQAREAETGDDLITRAERVRSSATTTDNPSGQVNYWQPIAGHEQRADGQFTSVFPGQPGNSVIAGHGSTFSAPFADMGALQPGDKAYFDRADGRTYTYVMVNAEILPNDNDTPIREYTHPDSAATLTTYLCSDGEGRTGSASSRYTVRWILESVEE